MRERRHRVSCPAGELVGIGMSGGRDSCLAAVMLRKQGLAVVGYTLSMMPDQDLGSVAALAGELGIRHQVIAAEDHFRSRVLDATVRSYCNGLTPNPCVICNRSVKFPLLAKAAAGEGCTSIATGHFARARSGDQPSLLRARDRAQDQSYFLCLLPRRLLARLRLPLGELSAKRGRSLRESLPMVGRCLPRTRDACFLRGGSLTSFLGKRIGARERGRILDLHGRVLGAHEGTILFTVGQRRGLGLPGGPWYVVETQSDTNAVVVGTRQDASGDSLVVEGINWLSVAEQTRDFRADVQIRSSHGAAIATVHPVSSTAAVVAFDHPQFGIAPGQYAVFYDGDLLLGGGMISPRRAGS